MAKKKKNGRAIGASYERHCAKLFTEYWGKGQFIRTKNFQVVGTEKRLAHGDIACVIGEPLILDQDFPFSIECKKSESWDFQEFLKGNPSLLIRGFWEQCKRDADLWEKEPLLVFTRNFHPDYVMMKSAVLNCFREDLFESFVHPHYFDFRMNGDFVTILTLQNFFNALQPIAKEV